MQLKGVWPDKHRKDKQKRESDARTHFHSNRNPADRLGLAGQARSGA